MSSGEVGAPSSGRDAITALRALQPARALTKVEAHAVAERQAETLLALMDVVEPPVPQSVIADVPGVDVDAVRDWPTSGMAVHTGRHWRIVVNHGESPERQRFSLAHEFKHVLDDPFVDAHQPYFDSGHHTRHVERICNYFAASLLMPRAWLERDWQEGMRNLDELARRYYVSLEAMGRRLHELGLTDRPPYLFRSDGRHPRGRT